MKKKNEEKIIFFCNGKKCGKYNKEPKDYLKKKIAEFGLEEKVCVLKMDCQGMCKKAPVVYIQPKDIWKKEVTEKKAKKIFEKYLL